MSYYSTPRAPYVPQQSVNPYGGMGTVGLATPLPNTQMDDFATGYLAGQDGGNNNGGFFGNEGLWAVIILAIIFGWGNYGNGRNGSDNGMASYIPYLVGTGATGQGGNDTRAALSEGFYQQDTSKIQSHPRNSIKVSMLHPVR